MLEFVLEPAVKAQGSCLAKGSSRRAEFLSVRLYADVYPSLYYFFQYLCFWSSFSRMTRSTCSEAIVRNR